jgi:hypothetical protein
MNDDQFTDTRRRNLRAVQLITLLSGLAFMIAAAVLLTISDIGSEMYFIALVLLVIGLGDMVIAFFVFRSASRLDSRRPNDSP